MDVEEPDDDPAAKQARKAAAQADHTPIALKLITGRGAKGSEVHRHQEIAHETVFEEDTPAEDDEDAAHQQYFTFSRGRYYAVAVVNSHGRTLRPLKGSLTVTYQIHRDGDSQPLSYTPLSDAWGDNLYYFLTANFKRSGNYTVSFLVEVSG